MTTARLEGGGSDGVAFLVAAGIVYEIIAACCSSPQTTEINAKDRADTLMKWVMLGSGQAVVFIIVAAYFDEKHRKAIIAGGGIAAALLVGQYVHAKNAGLNSDLPGTEDNDSPADNTTVVTGGTSRMGSFGKGVNGNGGVAAYLPYVKG